MTYRIEIPWCEYISVRTDMYNWANEYNVDYVYTINSDSVSFVFPDDETATAFKLKFGIYLLRIRNAK